MHFFIILDITTEYQDITTEYIRWMSQSRIYIFLCEEGTFLTREQTK